MRVRLLARLRRWLLGDKIAELEARVTKLERLAAEPDAFERLVAYHEQATRPHWLH